MKKHFILSLIAVISTTLLSGHGFSADTFVVLANKKLQHISTVCYRAQKKNITVVSYDIPSSYQRNSKAIRSGRSTSHCFVRFAFADELPTLLSELRRTDRRNDHAIAHSATAGGFDERLKKSKRHEVACTPTQEFYSATMHQWIPAYQLKVGDELLCAHNTKKTVAYIELVKKSLDIFTIEVKHTHTFFVTKHALLTHNMVISAAFSVGLSIPFGASAGGTAGGFFGPITFLVGAAIGCAVGALVKIVCNSKIPTYIVDTYDVNTFEQYVNQQPQVTPFSESQITVSSDYVATQYNAQPESKDACYEHMYCDENNDPLFSTTILNLPKEKLGCGNTTPEKPLVLITPAEPMPVFQIPGCRPLSDEERELLSGGCTIMPILESEKGSNIICGGYGIIPDELKDLLNRPIMLIENNTYAKVYNILDGATLVEVTDSGTQIYHKPKEYNDALKDFESLELDGVKSIKGGEGLTGSLPDGKQVNVRKTSKGTYERKDKWPTLEIRRADGKRSKIKIRYTKEKE